MELCVVLFPMQLKQTSCSIPICFLTRVFSLYIPSIRWLLENSLTIIIKGKNAVRMLWEAGCNPATCSIIYITAGGAVATSHQPTKLAAKLILRSWPLANQSWGRPGRDSFSSFGSFVLLWICFRFVGRVFWVALLCGQSVSHYLRIMDLRLTSLLAFSSVLWIM